VSGPAELRASHSLRSGSDHKGRPYGCAGGYTVAEQTLFEAGRGAAVQASRDALHKTMSARMRGTVESLTGRRVAALLPASHQDPDLTAELFVLEPDGGPATPP
jgi:hypothetical protein